MINQNNNHLEPFIGSLGDHEWEFVFPSDIDNEKVYNKFYGAVELLDYDDITAERIFKEIILKYPFHIDAYNHLSIAFRNQKKRFESFLTAEKAYLLGKNLFPMEFKVGLDRLRWSFLNNRPFLRACATFGLECQDKKDYNRALGIYQEILQFNKDDHQGIRYLVLECLFAQKKFHQAEEFLKSHSKERSLEFSYGRVIIEVLNHKKSKAIEILKEAIKCNPFVLEEIQKVKHFAPPPFRLPGEPFLDAGNPLGTVQEAFEYWKRNKSVLNSKEVQEFFLSIIPMQVNNQ